MSKGDSWFARIIGILSGKPEYQTLPPEPEPEGYIEVPPPSYDERFRPQFHFSPARGWLNDPNGLVYYDGWYHLFFQHTVAVEGEGDKIWGHAMSRDLVHWEQKHDVLYPDKLGTIYSGSAAVDWNNTAGLKTGEKDVLVAAYTSAGKHVNPPQPYTQSLACSHDGGETWEKYRKNPVLRNVSGGDDRDPRIFWHQPTQRWVMVLSLDKDPKSFGFFTSPDLKKWTQTSTIQGFYECPDLFELPVEGEPDTTKWVLLGADGGYMLGQFDGKTFQPETEKIPIDYGSNFYAAQTWNDVPAEDGRRIQIAWMRGGQYPGMEFSQQMSFPCELKLRRVGGALRVCRYPVREIERLHGEQVAIADKPLAAGSNPLRGMVGSLYDAHMEFEWGSVTEFVINMHGLTIVCTPQAITGIGRPAPLTRNDGKLELRFLLDRTSIELFANGGAVSITSCFFSRELCTGIEFDVKGGTGTIKSASVRKLRSTWAWIQRDRARTSVG